MKVTVKKRILPLISEHAISKLPLEGATQLVSRR